jgi:hypothetical protein
VRQVVESRSLVSFVVSTALGLYLFRAGRFRVENNMLQMVLLQKTPLGRLSRVSDFPITT